MVARGFMPVALWFVWLVLVVLPVARVLANVEGDALHSLQSNLKDPNNVLQSWDSTLVNPCTWFHVTCNSDNSVVRLDLGNANLSGQLVPQLGQLKNLQYLELYSNNIGGTIPTDLGNLTNLVSLDLYLNNFTGGIPDSLGNLSNLRFLRLNNNSLTGQIPKSLTSINALQVLDLSNNNLSGEVPSTGSFSLFTPISFANNPLLCGPGTTKPCPGAPPFSPPPPFKPPAPLSPQVNRRLDEWVKLEQVDLDSVETDVDEKVDDKATSLKMTRHQKRKIDETHVEAGHEELDAASLREHEEFTKVKNIAKIELGRYEIDTWYFSPFPPEYNDCSKLFFCEFCLNFMKRKEQLQRHMKKCDLKHPPGDEIYRNGTLSMFEVDGKKNKVYGQNLCYLAKLFLDHKTLYYDVDLFLFYILCECDDRGCHMVGYFSKEKHSEESYNLACILTLPPFQRKGYGKFLIAFSYELSKKEGKVGTPERPLSDLGHLSYKGYWTRVLVEILKKHKSNISIKELSDLTAIKAEDILTTLQSLDLIQYRKGSHAICADPKVLDRHLKAAGRGGLEVDGSKLIWTPYKEQG